ncbi:MAG: hypothetical protein U0R18_00660 [Mycobacterium sp.]
MSLTADRGVADCEFILEDLIAGIHASGYGQLDGGRSFSFHVEQDTLVTEIYRPRLTGPVPHAEDVVAVARRSVRDIDVSDERSLAAAVRDAVDSAVPVSR